jgi:hypothetical protein
MTQDEFKLLNIGDRVRQIDASGPGVMRRVYQLTGRMRGDPNGTPFFRPVDLRKPGGLHGRIVIFHHDEIERYEMVLSASRRMLDQHAAARTISSQRASVVAGTDAAAVLSDSRRMTRRPAAKKKARTQ